MSRKATPESFWARVGKTANCWEWTGSKDSGGYGSVTYHGKGRKAHRVAWRLTFGEIPDGLNVLHKCDNPKCVNPSHLFLGTQKDNMRDCSAKGRLNHADQRGERHPGNKLTNEKVLELRKLRAETGMSFGKLSKVFGITAMTAHRAITGKNWGHI